MILIGYWQKRMGMIMVVQSVQEKIKTINYVKIPERIPKEIIQNDSLLVLEKGLNKLEDRLVLTVKTVLGMNNEVKTQIYEIDRLENAISSMHEILVQQHDRIQKLEDQVEVLQRNGENRYQADNLSATGFWARLFSK